MPITKRDVDALQPGSKIWDEGKGAVQGFGVRCQARSRAFFLKTAIGGRQRWVTIGRYGAPWTVENARAEAQRLIGDIIAGNEPTTRKQKRETREVARVGDLCDRYMEAALAGLVLTRFNRPKRASTLEIDRGRIERHIRPLIGSVELSEVDGRIVKQLIADITAGKTATDTKTKARGRAIVSGGKATAARVADLLSGIMAWAVDEGHVPHNPVHGVRRFRSPPRDRFLSRAEMASMGSALRDARSTDSDFHPYVAPIVELLCLTGCRYSEIAQLQWSEVDFDDQCFRLKETKTGRSMRAVGETVLRILRSQSRLTSSDFVFPASRGDGPYQGAKRQIGELFSAASVYGATSHTLRHTFASVASELGYSDSTIGGLLGHANRGVTTRYIHRPDEALRVAAQSVSNTISARLAIEPSENVKV